MEKRGEKMFIGEFSCKIDSKGRMTLPSKFREQLDSTFVVARGLDYCIDLYPMSIWEEKLKVLKNIKVTDKKQRTYARLILSAATEVDFDGQGRINLPQSLISYSQIKKEVIVTGFNDKIEIWSKEIWDKFIEDSLEDIDSIVNDLDI